MGNDNGVIPSNCPGTSSDKAGKASACEGCPNKAICASKPTGPDPDTALIAERLKRVKHVVLVLSGKGGVGKSTVSTQVALSLAAKGFEVGLLDIDICGPSVPRMLGLENEEIHQSGTGWQPVYYDDTLSVMSIGFMLSKPDDAVIWRGPKKTSLLKSFLRDVDWGDLDYLVIDSPPGTSDEHITVAQCLLPCANLAGCVIVTTPQEVSLIDVRKEIVFCSKVNLPILGVVENMSGFVAPVGALNFSDVQGRNVTREALQMLSERFGGGLRVEGELLYAEAGAVKAMADEYGVPWLGSIAQDIEMSKATEQGRLIEQDGSVTVAGQVESIVCSLIARCEESHCRRDLGDRHDAKGST